jgi:small subunit ribosomal protein S2
MASIDQKAMLEAGVHFGHLKKKWNPKMLPYIFAERKGIHVIDLNKTAEKLEQAGQAMKHIAKSGRQILFVATKKQAKDIVKNAAMSCNMPFITERWLGGMMTNFTTIRKSVKKMQSIDKMFKDGTVNNITKKERLMLSRQKDKLEVVLGGIANMMRLPAAIYVVDISHEDIAILESKRLGLTTFGIVDTNSDPNKINFAIPGNDDSSKSIEYITNYLVECIKEGLAEKANHVSEEETEETEVVVKNSKRTKVVEEVTTEEVVTEEVIKEEVVTGEVTTEEASSEE